MKSKQTEIYEFIHQYCQSHDEPGFIGLSTEYISKRLGMQRTNVSSLLNKMVEEGSIQKQNGRPVHYIITDTRENGKAERSAFTDLIGYDGSLKEAILQAKRAILYPVDCPHLLFFADPGTGLTTFLDKAFSFAKENRILGEEAPFIKVNCAAYDVKLKDAGRINAEGFELSILKEADGGILLLENAEYLEREDQELLFEYIEKKSIYNQKTDLRVFVIGSLSGDASIRTRKLFAKYFMNRIELPALVIRPLRERAGLIMKFFDDEMKLCGEKYRVGREVFLCLMLCDTEHNLRDLKQDIRVGFASAYARGIGKRSEGLELLLADFPAHVRSGFSNLGYYKEQMDEIIQIYEQFEEIYGREIEAVKIKTIQTSGDLFKERTLYQWIEERFHQSESLMTDKNKADNIISLDIEKELKVYLEELKKQDDYSEESKLPLTSEEDQALRKFMNYLTQQTGHIYSESVLTILRCHLEKIEYRKKVPYVAGSMRTMNLIKENQEVYELCTEFLKDWGDRQGILTQMDDYLLFTLILLRLGKKEEIKSVPGILIVMHGRSTASSLVELVNNLVDYPVYGYDMPMEKNTEDAYQELKKLISKINGNAGMLVIYDLGILRYLLERVEADLNLSMAYLELPLPQMLLDMSKMGLMGESLGNIQTNFNEKIRTLSYAKRGEIRKNVILTLCSTGKGGAVSIKNYILKYINADEVEVINFGHGNPDVLSDRINAIKKKNRIICAVGSVDPKLIGIPFLTLTELVMSDGMALRRYIESETTTSENEELPWTSFQEVFDRLTDEFTYIDIARLRVILPELLQNILISTKHSLSGEYFLALMIHIACFMERSLAGEENYEDSQRMEDCSKYPELYKELKKGLSQLEELFDVEFSDFEIGNIIHIMIELEKQ